MADDQAQPQITGDAPIASESTVNAFMGLDEGKQRDTLGKMSPELKQALLSGIQTHKAAIAQSQPESGVTNFLRGAELGAASGLGIPESTSPSDVVTGALKNTGQGLARAGGAVAEDVGSLFVDPFLPKEQRLKDSKTYGVLSDMASGLEQAGGESWKGLQQRDPEMFAHGLGSLVTQVLSMKKAGEGGKAASAADATKRLSKTAAALDIGGKDVQSLRDSMPAIVKEAQKGGVKTISDFVDAHQQAKTAADMQYKQMLAPMAGQMAVDPAGQFVGPGQIVRNILSNDKPYLQNTPDGRKVSAALQKAARDFKRPVWTYDMLDDQRIAENQKLDTYFGKDTQGQSAAMANARTQISKAIADGARDTIYDEMERQNPGANVRQLKQTQGALWSLSDALDSKLSDLDARQLKFEGLGPLSRIHGGLSISAGGRPHSYLGGVLEALGSGPQSKSNALIKKGWQPRQYPFSPAVGALPVAHLAAPDEQQGGMTPPPTP